MADKVSQPTWLLSNHSQLNLMRKSKHKQTEGPQVWARMDNLPFLETFSELK